VIKFSANLSILFTELPFLDRFGAARRAGFDAVECWWPYEATVAQLSQLLAQERLTLVSINTPPGDLAAGEFGLAGQPGRESEFKAAFETAAGYAEALKARAIHVMCGNLGSPEGKQAAFATFRENLAWCLAETADSAFGLVIEPLNRRDRPHYLLYDLNDAVGLVEDIGSPRLKLLFDCYHLQIEGGNLTERLRRHLPITGHIQIAAVPDRGEPVDNEIDYRFLLAELQRLGWDGYVGCEYKPRSDTVVGLSWMSDLR